MDPTTIPGATEAIRSAQQSGWTAVLVVVVMLAFMLGLGWLVRAWLAQSEKRESRMAARIDTLEDYQRSTLGELVNKNTVAFAGLTSLLGERPCLINDKHSLTELQKRHDGGAL